MWGLVGGPWPRFSNDSAVSGTVIIFPMTVKSFSPIVILMRQPCAISRINDQIDGILGVKMEDPALESSQYLV